MMGPIEKFFNASILWVAVQPTIRRMEPFRAEKLSILHEISLHPLPFNFRCIRIIHYNSHH
jgi:hypothetical protein